MSGAAIRIKSPRSFASMAGGPAREHSAQQDQARHGIGVAPYDGVLPQGPAQRLGGFQLQPEDEVARLARPLVGWVLADAFDVGEAAAGEFQPEIGVPLSAGCGADVLAERVAGRDEGAAVRPEALVRGGEGGAGLVDSQSEWLGAVDPVVGLAAWTRPASTTESENKKALLNRRADAVARLVAPEGAASAFAIHLARVGRLAWASAQFQMCR